MPYPTNHPYEQTKQGTALEEEPELNQIVIQNIVEKIFETESTKLTKRLARNMNHFPYCEFLVGGRGMGGEREDEKRSAKEDEREEESQSERECSASAEQSQNLDNLEEHPKTHNHRTGLWRQPKKGGHQTTQIDPLVVSSLTDMTRRAEHDREMELFIIIKGTKATADEERMETEKWSVKKTGGCLSDDFCVFFEKGRYVRACLSESNPVIKRQEGGIVDESVEMCVIENGVIWVGLMMLTKSNQHILLSFKAEQKVLRPATSLVIQCSNCSDTHNYGQRVSDQIFIPQVSCQESFEVESGE
ncbi:hypothetical protein BLNAU_5419 [Blattamonas nauphoetae]|uniref:Uncharacterized protein n=1 Tax=Blattamonas nauphoetae TaxID=2049346 RepID=A0ABQ9Y7C1_9EUKA|nr:hypothetical protein BLNAU_5419 [Blattamonas nauphoetae]